MKHEELKRARQRRRWSQMEAARRLGVSQAYLSMLERGQRLLPRHLARKAMHVYGLPPTILPLADPFQPTSLPDNQTLAVELAALRYPGFAYLRVRRPTRNPAELLLLALAQNDLEARLVEALPWLVLRYAEAFDTGWLVEQARLHNLQNRLGFVVTLARRCAEVSPQSQDCVRVLRQLEQHLEESRLAKEDTLCQASLPEPKRHWLAQNRSPEAAHWNLWTDWRPEVLRYAPWKPSDRP